MIVAVVIIAAIVILGIILDQGRKRYLDRVDPDWRNPQR